MRNTGKDKLSRYSITNKKNKCLLVLGILLFFNTLLLSSCSSQISTPTPDLSKQDIPHSMKGYEIYSWQDEGQWVFKLITGTNRQKTIDEILSISEPIQEDAWVNIKINGVDDLKIILGSLPKDESLFWMAENGIETAADQSILLEYPPDFMVEDIRRFCEQIGVYLTLSQ
jgi:hypothetical protein